MTAPRMRASDTDRQRTVDRLADHFTAGRLTAAEYDERVQQAYATTYLDELPALTADLPEHGGRFAGTGGGDEAGWPGGDSGWGRDPGRSGWDYGYDENMGYGYQRSVGYPRGPRSGGRDRWYGPGGNGRRRVPVLPLLLLALLLVGLTHGFILIPVFWIGLAMLFLRRHRGMWVRGHHGR